MGFLSLYRKYRPKKFSDLVGQNYVIKTIKNSLKNNRIVHAYLFSGPRGTGKTSTAKVFAKALNCKDKNEIEPCTECINCEKIETGQSIDIIEIDAASNRGIDEIRDLREKVKFYPSEGNYKVYIIDEVHMLTKGAFNALLKTLEEPPENVVFILATTEPHEVITTILSRCQCFDFSLLSVSEIRKRLIYICEQEQVEFEKDALNLIAHSSDGGLRDAISILDQAISYTDGNLTIDDLTKMLGKIDKKILSQFVKHVIDSDTTAALELVNEIIEKGKDVSRFVIDLIEHSRQLLLVKQCGINSGLLQYSKSRLNLIKKESQAVELSTLLRIINILTDIEKNLKYSNQPRLSLEIGIVKLTSPEADASIESLQTRISEMEYKLRELQKNGINTGSTEHNVKGKTANNFEITQEQKEQKEQEEQEEKKDLEGKNLEGQKPKNQLEQQQEQSKTGMKSSNVNQNNEFDIDEVRKGWPAILSQVKNEDIKTQAYLIEGKPLKVVDNTVFIEFSQQKKFHRKCAQKKKKLITKKFNKILSRNCEIKFILKGEKVEQKSTAKSVNNSKVNKAKKSKKKSRNQKDESDNLIEKVAAMFNGDIIKVNEDYLENIKEEKKL